MTLDLDKLSTRLEYQFKDRSLLTRALTHRSAAKNHNERFEFLGDSILGLIVAEELYCLYPDATEGELSRMRAGLVNASVLAEIAIEVEIGTFLNLGTGERKSGGQHRKSILSDAVEAIIAAVYLDAGLEASRGLIKKIYANRLVSDVSPDKHKDSKTRLQELLQGQQLALPQYSITEVAGQAHDQTFTVECRVELSDEVYTGSGKSKRLAEQDAARKVLMQLDSQP